MSLVVHGFQLCWNILKGVCWMVKITRIFTVTFILCLPLLWTEFFFLSEAKVGIRGEAHGGQSLVELNNLSQRLKLWNIKVHKTRTCPFFSYSGDVFPEQTELQVSTWYCFIWHEKLKALLTYMQCVPLTSFKVMALLSADRRLFLSFAATLSQIFMPILDIMSLQHFSYILGTFSSLILAWGV